MCDKAVKTLVCKLRAMKWLKKNLNKKNISFEQETTSKNNKKKKTALIPNHCNQLANPSDFSLIGFTIQYSHLP